MTGPCVLKIIALANGQPSTLSGQYVVEYDPLWQPPDGPYNGGRLVTTPDKAQAMTFASAGVALELWRKGNGRTRPDGKPDRPLTAYTVTPEAVYA